MKARCQEAGDELVRRITILITSVCAGTLLLAASYSEAADHGMDEKVLSQISKKLQAIVDSGQSSGMVTFVIVHALLLC